MLSGFAGGSFKSFQTRAAVIFKERVNSARARFEEVPQKWRFLRVLFGV